jgi:hypothetical protein
VIGLKKLVLRKEVLRDLDTIGLRQAAGGFVLTGTETTWCPTLPVTACQPALSLVKCVATLHGCTTAVDCP